MALLAPCRLLLEEHLLESTPRALERRHLGAFDAPAYFEVLLQLVEKLFEVGVVIDSTMQHVNEIVQWRTSAVTLPLNTICGLAPKVPLVRMELILQLSRPIHKLLIGFNA